MLLKSMVTSIFRKILDKNSYRQKAFPHMKMFQKRRLHRPILAAKKRINLYLKTVKIA
jgi:uncharacterized protein YllA (UPF0747 family)